MGDEKPKTEPPTTDGLMARIEALLKRVPVDRDDDDEDEPVRGKTVGYERFFRANQRAKAAEEGLRTLLGEVADMRKAQGIALDQAKAEAAAAVVRLAAQHQEDLGLVDLGFDAAGREALRATWSRLPEATRPKTAREWWDAQLLVVDAHRKDPEKATAPDLPKTLLAYVPAPKAAGDGEPAKGGSVAPAGMRVQVGLSPDRGVKKGPAASKADKLRTAKTWAELVGAAED